MPNLTGVVRGKTGHDEHRVHALAGLIRGDVVFAVLQNGLAGLPSGPPGCAQDRFVTALAGKRPAASRDPSP